MSNFIVKKTGFSLIELSVVILIISIIAAGMLSISSVNLDADKKQITQKRIQAIYKALGNYVAKNYYLPCPASLELAKTDADYGAEEGDTAATNTARTCTEAGVYKSSDVGNIIYGMVPVAALGLPEDMAVDGFGTRFGYVVNNYLASPNYSNTTGGFSEGFSYYSENSAEMVQIYSAKSTSIVKQNVAFAIISHGPNKLGGYNPSSIAQNPTTGATTQEGYNIVSNIVSSAADFGKNPSYSGYITFTDSDSDSGFDDILFYKTRDEIITDFGLEFLYFCDNNDDNYSANYYSSSFNYGYQGQLVHGDGATTCDNDPSFFPAKRCGAKGTSWIEVTTCPEPVF